MNLISKRMFGKFNLIYNFRILTTFMIYLKQFSNLDTTKDNLNEFFRFPLKRCQKHLLIFICHIIDELTLCNRLHKSNLP